MSQVINNETYEEIYNLVLRIDEIKRAYTIGSKTLQLFTREYEYQIPDEGEGLSNYIKEQKEKGDNNPLYITGKMLCRKLHKVSFASLEEPTSTVPTSSEKVQSDKKEPDKEWSFLAFSPKYPEGLRLGLDNTQAQEPKPTSNNIKSIPIPSILEFLGRKQDECLKDFPTSSAAHDIYINGFLDCINCIRQFITDHK